MFLDFLNHCKLMIFSILIFGLLLVISKKTQKLNSGDRISRESPFSIGHRYVIDLEKGQFFYLELIQENVDLEMTLLDPLGEIKVARNSVQKDTGVETLGFVAQQTGRFQIHITVFDNSKSGRYRLVMHGPRAPSKVDRERAQATEYFYQAYSIARASKFKEWEQVVKRFLKARECWAIADEPLQEAVSLIQAGSLLGRHAKERRLAIFSEAETILAREGHQELRADVLQQMADTAFFQGPSKVIGFYNAALDLQKEPDLDRAEILVAKAWFYRFIGNFEEATELFVEAEAIQIQHGTRRSRCTFHHNYGNFLIRTGKAESAIPHLEEALKLFSHRDDKKYFELLCHFSKAYEQIEQYDTASNYYKKSMVFLIGPNEEDVSPLIQSLAKVLIQLWGFEDAFELMLEPTGHFAENCPETEYLKVLINLARTELVLGKESPAWKYAQEALGILNGGKVHPQDHLSKQAFRTIRNGSLELKVDQVFGSASCSQSDKEALFEHLDHLRSASLVEALKNDPHRMDTLEVLAVRINYWTKLKAQSDSEELQLVCQQNLINYSRRYGRALRKKIFPETDFEQSRSLNFGQLNSLINQENSLLLYYVMGRERGYLLTFDGTKILSYDLDYKKDIKSDLVYFIRLLKKSSRFRSRRDVDSFGQKLKRLIPEELLSENKSKKLVIVPGDVLHEMPFSALPRGEKSVLGAQFEISYLPSLATLEVLRRKERLSTSGMAIFADPASVGKEFPRLPFAREEGEMIATRIPSARLFLGKDASLANVSTRNLGRMRLLHFAAHGLRHPERGDLSSLVLAGVNKDGKPIKQFLRASRIVQLELNAELVVLSACESGLGETIHRAGMVGLPQAFLLSGAASVLVSLWKIDDQATMIFMDHFYRYLNSHELRPIEALRLAKRDMAEDETWGDPHFWAAFRLMGDSQACTIKRIEMKSIEKP